MSIADKLTTIAENEQRVYQAGYDKGVAEGGGGVVGDDYVAEAPPKTIKTYTDTRSMGFSDNAFNGYTELESVYAPNVIGIGAYAFANTNLRKFNFCRTVTNIDGINITGGYCGEGVFENCTNLETVDFGFFTEVIPPKCFRGCSKLKTLILRGDYTVWMNDNSPFEGTALANGIGYIYVQSKNIADYRGYFDAWTPFANQFRILEDYTVDGTIYGELDETKI